MISLYRTSEYASSMNIWCQHLSFDIIENCIFVTEWINWKSTNIRIFFQFSEQFARKILSAKANPNMVKPFDVSYIIQRKVLNYPWQSEELNIKKNIWIFNNHSLKKHQQRNIISNIQMNNMVIVRNSLNNHIKMLFDIIMKQWT